MKVAVVGTGYVGLVTGTCLAETGNEVICVDINEEKINKLQSGQITIYEPGLEVLFERNTKEKRLIFTTILEEAIIRSDVIFLALPTPPGEDGSADLSSILKVVKELALIIDSYKIIVDKSTVPVGTAEKVEKILGEKLNESLYDVVSNPEFLREGAAVGDFMKPERIVIGSSSDKAKAIMGELYKPFVRQGNPIYFMDLRSAEMTKYASNSYLATRISFMNEIANLCDKLGANVDFVRLGMGSDSRIGKRFLFPGVGYGGSCFPKDVHALKRTAENHAYDFKILNAVMEVNQIQKSIPFQILQDQYGDQFQEKNIAIWGLSFKPETDDVREAPSLTLIASLIGKCKSIRVFDPEAMNNIKDIFGDALEYGDSKYSILTGADALVILTEWNEFRTPDFSKMHVLNDNLIIDGRNIFDPAEMHKRGLIYFSIGRPTSHNQLL